MDCMHAALMANLLLPCARSLNCARVSTADTPTTDSPTAVSPSPGTVLVGSTIACV